MNYQESRFASWSLDTPDVSIYVFFKLRVLVRTILEGAAAATAGAFASAAATERRFLPRAAWQYIEVFRRIHGHSQNTDSLRLDVYGLSLDVKSSRLGESEKRQHKAAEMRSRRSLSPGWSIWCKWRLGSFFFSGACREGTKSWELLKLLSFWGGFFVSRDGGQFGGIDTGVVT